MSSIPTKTQQLEQAFSAFWGMRNPRERLLLVVAVIFLMLTLLYVLNVQPALKERMRLQKKIPVLQQEATQLQALSTEAIALAATVTTTIPLTQKEIEETLHRRGLIAQDISVHQELVKIQFPAVSFPALLNWLNDMQKRRQLLVTDANISAQNNLGTVNATLNLRQQKNE